MHNISSLWCFRFFSNFLIIWKLKLYFWNFLEQKNALTIEQQQGSVSNFVYLVFSITRKILQALKKDGQCIYLLLTISPDISDATECGYPEQSPESRVHLEEGIARYSCTKGYSIAKDQDQRHCRADGFWSGHAPRCKREWKIFILTFTSA